MLYTPGWCFIFKIPSMAAPLPCTMFLESKDIRFVRMGKGKEKQKKPHAV
jgi:hypothetical protein